MELTSLILKYRIGKSIETESRLMVAKEWGEEENWETWSYLGG